ncbi:MAG: histidine phosphatase family protein [Candidatus Dormibacteraeota bacterium]|nr:histidine phosphatase family protein [Candidatus Dormibacteraeota bacterium]MBV8445193.1 histidine phosphatase family protein [Candidatus Dormibacteraeota bacterium]
MSDPPRGFRHRVVVVRHGATAWSGEGRHTGKTDVPLTEEGRGEALRLRSLLPRWTFAAVYTSPLQRARDTCELAGYGEVAVSDPDLVEWDYGKYDGLTTAEIRATRPGWDLWRDGVPDGETLEEVTARADAVLSRAGTADGDVLLFGHGHILRVLTARWLEQPAELGRRFRLDPAAPGVLHHEHEWPTLNGWNLG